ncbi:hypothetical protein D9M68_151080 [compost metagenome]
MQQINAQDLARKKPNATCCDCGREAASSGNQTWTIQGGNFRCRPCSVNEGLY